MSRLRWEKSGVPEAETAYSGWGSVGSIVKRSSDGVWVWYLDGVNLRHSGRKGSGQRKRRAQARAAVERAWDYWLSLHDLIPLADYEAALEP